MPGQSVIWLDSLGDEIINNVVSVSADNLTIYLEEPIIEAIPDEAVIQFGPISDFTYIPYAYNETEASDWFLEEARIRGGYNNTL
jgi:chemotaxis protein CheY-P-specific phosphatase CheC